MALGVLAFACALLFNGPGKNFILLVPIIGFVLLWAFVLLFKALGRQKITFYKSPYVALLVFWLVWMLASVTWSVWFEISWVYAFTIGMVPIGFLIIAHERESEFDWTRFWHFLLLGGLCAGGWAIVEYLFTQQRSHGPFMDFNSFGALMNAFFFPLVFRYFEHASGKTARLWKKAAYGFSLAVIAAALFTTYSRGAIAVWIVLLIVSLILIRARYRNFWRHAATVLAISLVAFAAVKLYPSHAINRTIGLANDPSTQSRLLMWHSMLDIYATHPVLGTGLGTFKREYRAFRNPAEDDSSGDLGHNDYIQFLQEGGPVQLACFLLTGLGVLVMGAHVFRASGRDDPDAGDKRESLGLVIGLVALWGQGLVNFIFYILPIAILAGFYLGQIYRHSRTAGSVTLRLPVSRFTAAFALGVVWTLVVGSFAVDGLAAMVIMGQSNLAFAQQIRNNPRRLYHFAEVVAALRPHNTVPLQVIAGSDLSAALANRHSGMGIFAAGEALDTMERIMRLDPVDSIAHLGLARLLIAYPELRNKLPNAIPGNPNTLIKIAIRHDPVWTPPYALLAKRYETEGKDAKAFDLLTHQAPLWLRIPAPELRARTKLMKSALALAVELKKNRDIAPLAQIVSELQRDVLPSAKDIRILTGRDITLGHQAGKLF